MRLLLIALLAAAVAGPASAATDVVAHLLGDDGGHWEVLDATGVGASGRVRAIADRRPRASAPAPPVRRLWTIDAATGAVVEDAALDLGAAGVRPGELRFAADDVVVAVAGGRYARLELGKHDVVQHAIGPTLDTLVATRDLRDDRTLVAGAFRRERHTSIVDFADGTVADVAVDSGAPYVTGVVDAGGLGFVLVGGRTAEQGASGPVYRDVWIGSFTPAGVLRAEATFDGRNPRVVAGAAGSILLAFDASTEQTEERIVAVGLSLGLDVRWRKDVATLAPRDAIEPPHLCALPGGRVLVATVADRGPWVAVIDVADGASRVVVHGTETIAPPPYVLACAGARGVLFSTGVRTIEAGGRTENLMKVQMLTFPVDGE